MSVLGVEVIAVLVVVVVVVVVDVVVFGVVVAVVVVVGGGGLVAEKHLVHKSSCNLFVDTFTVSTPL